MRQSTLSKKYTPWVKFADARTDGAKTGSKITMSSCPASTITCRWSTIEAGAADHARRQPRDEQIVEQQLPEPPLHAGVADLAINRGQFGEVAAVGSEPLKDVIHSARLAQKPMMWGIPTISNMCGRGRPTSARMAREVTLVIRLDAAGERTRAAKCPSVPATRRAPSVARVAGCWSAPLTTASGLVEPELETWKPGNLSKGLAELSTSPTRVTAPPDPYRCRSSPFGNCATQNRDARRWVGHARYLGGECSCGGAGMAARGEFGQDVA